MNIHYKSYGQGRPLVFFHGWGFNHQIWMPLVPFLENNYELILVDLPGFGSTPMMDWESFKVNLLSLLVGHFVVAGWSMGGLYATRLAIEEPERVCALINITSSPKFIQEPPWPGIAKEVLAQFHANLLLDSKKTLNDFIALQAGSINCLQEPKLTMEGLKSGLSILQEWDLREGLSRVSIPTCFIFGRLDPITSVKTMTTMEAFYPNFKYILFKKAAHMPFLSHPELFITELLGFIK